MTADEWTAADRYLEQHLLGEDPVLDAALAAGVAAGLPAIQVSPTQGKFLHLLARAAGAQRILELGTLAGYSTIWLARALPASGRLVTLELSEEHARVARSNLDNAGVGDAVDIRVGPAAETLRGMTGEPPFDLVFIDADKPGYPEYLRLVLPLTRPGSLIVADNVVRRGQIVDPDSDDVNVRGAREFLELLGSRPGVTATALQTVGSKGHDGFAIALVEES